MKNLHLLQIFVLTLFMLSCSADDSNSDSAPLSDEPGMVATIDGGTFNNFLFTDGAYQASLGTNDTMSIDIADALGNQVSLFLNGTNGFGADIVKNMGNIDSNNFMTYALIRPSSPQISYYSSSGNVTISENRSHPTTSGIRLISGTFNITASTLDGTNTTSMVGSFTELEYED
ncbi:hypothetical protein [Winogradskyella forsetii]|uniref:hypothetical protein n=1 Tax=Winogradskyella forsetii TaxID=2686077 RepID=UPI0015BF55E6|nr:hypothetical protein [Winogradskyella forsetii]